MPSPHSVPWKYVIPIGLLVVIVGFLLHRPKPDLKPTPIAAAGPTFHPHPDWDAPQKSQENMSRNYELHFDPNLSYGQERLDAQGASLIVKKRTQ
jgi:hypothetical protein